MIFTELRVAGAWLISPERRADERGFFARTFCQREFAARSLAGGFVQCSVSHNVRRGTLRGMHYQAAPREEEKIVRCTRGTIFDVVVDLRPRSPTFLRWDARELSAENRRQLYVPRGVAHGFLTLEDDSEVFYQISEFFEPAAARGVRWDDPRLKIDWPEPVRVISPRDASYPDISVPLQLVEGAHG